VIDHWITARWAAEIAAIVSPARAVGATATWGGHLLEWHNDDFLPAPATEVLEVKLYAAAHESVIENFEFGLREIARHAANPCHRR